MATQERQTRRCDTVIRLSKQAQWAVPLFLLLGGFGCKPNETTPAPFAKALPATLSIPATSGAENPAIHAENADTATALNPGLVEISAEELKTYRQVAAISDVHGHFLNALHLLQKAQIVDAGGKWIGEKSLLVVVGDSIDKGPSSIPMLRCWLDLQTQASKAGGRVLVLLGNHEAELLAEANGKGVSPDLRKELDAEGMTPEQLTGDSPDPKGYKLGIFLRQMPLGAKIGTWLFCHAGWPPDPQTLAPAKFTSKAMWKAWQEQAQKQDYAALTQEGAEGKTEPEYSVLEKKFVGEAGNQELQDSGEAKWWEKEQEVGRLLTRLDQYGFTGVVFGHQPAAFGLKDAVGPYTNPKTDKPDYRLLKIDSGMATAPYDGLQDGKQPRNAGHMIVFQNVSVLTQSLEDFKPNVLLPGLLMIANADTAVK